MSSVLIVDDEPNIRRMVGALLASEGYEVRDAADGSSGLARAAESMPDVVLLDLMMPGELDGIATLARLRETAPDVPVIMMSGKAGLSDAVKATKLGAFNFLEKPLSPEGVLLALASALELRRVRREARSLREDLGLAGEMIGASPAMDRVRALIARVAPTDARVLVTGESGTGKELVASAIHSQSPRRDRPFVRVNCAAIPRDLVESEMFGHEKGAFTGASDRRAGCFELADRGTLFLDEIGEMTPTTQVKLLRVLQERKFRRLGGRAEQSVDVRVIAATNIDPVEAVRTGKLREDLFYRLNVFAFRLPPLRERKEDLPLLVQAFINEFNTRNQKAIAGVDNQAMRALEQHSWPGNVRELRNVIERATIIAPGPMIEPKHLVSSLTVEPARQDQPQVALGPGVTVAEAERRLILMTLEHTRDNKTRAAEILGISLKTLHNKLNKLRLRPRKME
jgi:two-component system, NtrC family, nitrogen regulation response regulator NtrX